MLKILARWRSFLLLACVIGIAVGRACSQETYGPYHVTGYNYTDRNIAAFDVDDFGAGDSAAHQSGGGGGFACCLDIPNRAKTLHIKVVLGLTWEQFDKNLPNDTYETDIPVPELPNKHDGYIEFHFLTGRKIEAKWVKFPTTPNIPKATN
ncbi:DUF3304 domain-containing protein [Paraburkholderia acidipaludis]|uniref:DUF3304 domain-containing protein n=1 Tax=Paraburkholderia acidipaludis TaxID=660537 RepID=UPI00047FFB2F|nr:DUF3304 domain-containing protein [Paraburkholderia acidipaludis]